MNPLAPQKEKVKYLHEGACYKAVYAYTCPVSGDYIYTRWKNIAGGWDSYGEITGEELATGLEEGKFKETKEENTCQK